MAVFVKVTEWSNLALALMVWRLLPGSGVMVKVQDSPVGTSATCRGLTDPLPWTVTVTIWPFWHEARARRRTTKQRHFLIGIA